MYVRLTLKWNFILTFNLYLVINANKDFLIEILSNKF